MSAPSVDLERRYRRLLVLLPRAYRAARGEEMLTVLMDAAPESRRWPKPGETLSLAFLGVKVRSGLAGTGPDRAAARSLIRAVALTGSLMLAFSGMLGFLSDWRSWHILRAVQFWMDLDRHPHGMTQMVADMVTGGLWPVVMLALILGRRWPARILAIGIAVESAVWIDGVYTFAAVVPTLVVAAAIVAATGADHRPVRRPGRWAAGLAGLGLLAFYLADIAWRRVAFPGVQWLWLSPVAVLGVAAVAVAWRRARTSALWPTAFALVGALAAGLQLDRLFGVGVFSDARLVIPIAGELALIAVAAYAVLRERGARRDEPGSAIDG